MLEIQTLQDRVDDTKDREVIRSIRKELDDYKIKYPIHKSSGILYVY